MRKARLRAEIKRLQAELDAVRPYLALAREVHDEIARLNDGTVADGAALVDAIDAIPRRERAAVARAVFDRLATTEQWAIVERVFGDAELREVLRERRDAIAARDAIVHDARRATRLDVTTVPRDERVTIGLFREADVNDAMALGSASTNVARRLVLRAVDGGGTFQVIEDVYNPAGGYFVTAAYDETTWRTTDRLEPNARVRVGTSTRVGAEWCFDPVLVPGARFDVEVNGAVRTGPLHVGYVTLGDRDIFATPGR